MIKINSAFPLYVVKNLEAQKAFYADAFGFEAVFYDPDFYVHLINPANGIEIGFMLEGLATQPAMLRTTARVEGMVISFEVDKADAAFQRPGRTVLISFLT